MNLLLVLSASLLLGMRHAADPDHLLAVSTIVSRERSLRRSAEIGALWGLGHTIMIALVGAAIVLFDLAFTPRLGLSMEFAVAVMLIALGALNLVHLRAAPTEISLARPFVVGIVHGLAGSAAVTLLLLSLIGDPRLAALYLLVFGLGTVAGMAVVTLTIAASSVYAADRIVGIQRWVRGASGALSLAFGFYLAYQVGIVEGLFTGELHWTPE